MPPAIVLDWAQRVQDYGGSQVSTITISALSTFWRGIEADGLASSILMVNPIVPDNLIAAITPLKSEYGFRCWANAGFLAADLSVNGLQADGNKFLNTGIIAGTPYGGQPIKALGTTAGLAVYVSGDDATTGQEEFSVYGPAISSWFSMTTHFNNGHSTFGCWRYDTAANFADTVSPSPAVGYFSGHRTSSTAITMYFANSSTAHAAIATGNGSSQTGAIEANQPLYAFCANNNGGTANYSKKRCSFFAFTLGLSSVQDALLYARAQALRVALGGGYA